MPSPPTQLATLAVIKYKWLARADTITYYHVYHCRASRQAWLIGHLVSRDTAERHAVSSVLVYISWEDGSLVERFAFSFILNTVI